MDLPHFLHFWQNLIRTGANSWGWNYWTLLFTNSLPLSLFFLAPLNRWYIVSWIEFVYSDGPPEFLRADPPPLPPPSFVLLLHVSDIVCQTMIVNLLRKCFPSLFLALSALFASICHFHSNCYPFEMYSFDACLFAYASSSELNDVCSPPTPLPPPTLFVSWKYLKSPSFPLFQNFYRSSISTSFPPATNRPQNLLVNSYIVPLWCTTQTSGIEKARSNEAKKVLILFPAPGSRL